MRFSKLRSLSPPKSLTPRPPEPRIEPPDKSHTLDVLVKKDVAEEEDGKEDCSESVAETATTKTDSRLKAFLGTLKFSFANRAESFFLLSAWLVFFLYNVSAYGKGSTWS